MDPYLEDRWSNVHVLMVAAISAALKRSLPKGLEARPEESVRVETIAGERLRGYRPDFAVVAVETKGPASPAAVAGWATLTAPIELSLHRGPIILRNVQIVDTRSGDRVVTVVEVLSPQNKLSGRLNDDYCQKLGDFEEGDANWVELDLLRSSRRHMPVPWSDLPRGTAGPYLALAYRSATGKVSAYPIGVRERLPTIAIPLRVGDPDVPLDLQAVLDRVYDEGPFENIDYTRPPDPPLSPADAAWAADLLAKRR